MKSILEDYGERLAGVMLYGGNSYLIPRDDAPRVVDVHHNPNDPERPYLEVGIDRPRAVYILYPGKAGEYLCRGAVLPYHEFQSARRLTDGEWKALLDGDARPQVPAWLAPALAAGGIGKAKL